MKQTILPAGASGASYFIKGFELIRTKGLRRFVLLPLSVNLILFSVAFYWLFQQLSRWIEQLMASLPEWLSWLDWALWPLAVVTVLVVFSFIFSSVMNWIAAPFNGLLAEQVERRLTGKSVNDDGFADIIRDIPRVLGREWQKLKYYLPRALLLLVLFVIPGIGQTFAPVIWFLFSAWMMAIQYLDYPFDNHKIHFGVMRTALGERKGPAFTFGAAVAAFAMIPVVNLVVMPVAICGATALWVDQYRAQVLERR
ncbi:sulfate transporter CysZ [Ferrimonas sediminicola]|uniref:Sulfate transporter CysZ n=1 Tax=Ferrimonas sediminicola TaxID=2569538 RepID=A0A4U1BJD6_9GAMM|nr:sulfate transporter CysZ [Ferrimonas sediminicola]TKB50659.1 sulfate transporter CysZ [Ferrimonas sediminicola]